MTQQGRSIGSNRLDLHTSLGLKLHQRAFIMVPPRMTGYEEALLCFVTGGDTRSKKMALLIDPILFKISLADFLNMINFYWGQKSIICAYCLRLKGEHILGWKIWKIDDATVSWVYVNFSASRRSILRQFTTACSRVIFPSQKKNFSNNRVLEWFVKVLPRELSPLFEHSYWPQLAWEMEKMC